jgi:DNA-binding PadR family transcriptional regulator
MLRYVLLALLGDGKARHGYALMKAYTERSGVHLSIGNVYRELQRLTADGYIHAVANPIGDDPRRAPYEITSKGRENLARWIDAPAESFMRWFPDAIAYRLTLIGDLDALAVENFLDSLRAQLWAQSKSLERERTIAAARRANSKNPLDPHLFNLSRRVKHIAADIELIDEVRAALAEAGRLPAAAGPQNAHESAHAGRTKPKAAARGKAGM